MEAAGAQKLWENELKGTSSQSLERGIQSQRCYIQRTSTVLFISVVPSFAQNKLQSLMHETVFSLLHQLLEGKKSIFL